LRKEFNVNTEAAFLDLKLGMEDWSTIGHQRSFWWPFEQEEWYITVTRGSGTIHGYIMLYIYIIIIYIYICVSIHVYIYIIIYTMFTQPPVWFWYVTTCNNHPILNHPMTTTILKVF
jgi:hypothetical protein